MRSFLVILILVPLLVDAAPFKAGRKFGPHGRRPGDKNAPFSPAYIKASREKLIKKWEEFNSDRVDKENPYLPEEAAKESERSVFSEIEEANKGNTDLEEGDIKTEHGHHDIHRRAAVQYDSQRWPQGVIPYDFDPAFGSSSLVEAAMGEIMQKTCISFVRTTGTSQKLWIHQGNGCWSYVGKTNLNQQPLSIGNECTGHGTIVHELMHAIGFYHEQSRSDRDDFVRIEYANIKSGKENNFKIHTPSRKFGTYDFGSVMHYSAYAFAIDKSKPTIVALNNPNGNIIMGQRNGMANTDSAGINSLYKCSTTPVAINGGWGEWTAYGSCSVTCGDGTRERTRQCNSPPPSNGGQTCPGTNKQSEVCNMGSCGTGSSGDKICDFDTSMCGWTTEAVSGTFNALTWTRHQGPTRSVNTGPSGDHTSGSGHYLYVETSVPAESGQYAVLKSPMLPALGNGQKRCLTYHISRYGSGMGRTELVLKKNGAEVMMRQHTTDEANVWKFEEVEIDATYVSQVIFKGYKRFTWQSDMALDDIHINNGPCPTSSMDCDFEGSTCSWTVKSEPQYVLAIKTGRTPSSNTGPSAAFSGQEYFYAEGSHPAYANMRGTLTGPYLPVKSGSSCLTFQYHMYGVNVGYLRVFKVYENGSRATLLTYYGNKGNLWKTKQLTLSRSQKFKVEFEFQRGTSWSSDIALDKISFNEDGACN